MAFSRTPSEGRDLLRTTTINETIRGLGGSDHISSKYTGAKLYGGEGKDWLMTTLEATMDADDTTEPSLTALLDGGNGNDQLFVMATSSSDIYALGPNLEFDLYGGAGSDEIWIESSGRSGTQTAKTDSGDGDDFVSSTIRSHDDNGATSNSVEAGAGNDIVYAFGQSGFMGGSTNSVWGNDGDDDIEAIIITNEGGGLNEAYGGNGADKISVDGRGMVENVASGGDGDDIIVSTALASGDFPTAENKVYGNNGADKITLVADVEGTPVWSNSYNYGYGGNGDDVLTATGPAASDSDTSQSRLYGGSGADSLRVYGGSENLLDGGAGNDTLTGGGADDILIGGSGADQLKGGRGDDTFRYLWMTGTKETTRDTILDFGFGSKSRGDDVIDLSEIDANTGKSGNQAFKFGGTTKTGTGYVWVEEDDSGSGSFVMADNGGSETLIIAVDDGAGTTPSDWSASDFLL